MEPDRPFDPEYLLIGIAIGITIFSGLLIGFGLVYLWVT